MNTDWVLRLYPGNEAVAMLASILLQATIVGLLAWVIAAALVQRNAVLRHAICVAALVCILISPLIAVMASRFTLSMISLPLKPSVSRLRPAASSVPLVSKASPARATNTDSPAEPENPVLAHGSVRLGPLSPKSPTVNEVRQSMHDAAKPTAPPPLAETARAGDATNEFPAIIAVIFIVIWAGGTIILLARFVHGWRVMTSLRRDVIPFEDYCYKAVLAHVCANLGVRRLPTITLSATIGSPVTVGWLRPMVILPADLPELLSSDDMADVLTHECAHVLRRDYLIGMVQRVVAMLYWPIPLVHLLNRCLSSAREEACDNYVLRHGQPRRYAHCLVTLAERVRLFGPVPATLGLIWPRRRMEERIKAIIDPRRRLMTRVNAWSVTAAALVLLTAAVVLCPSAGRGDDVTIKTITPDRPPDVKPPDQPKTTPTPSPGTGNATTPKPDQPKPADPARAGTPAEKPLFDWPPPGVVVRTTVDRFGLSEEQKAKTGAILNAADREATALLKEMKDKDPQERRAAIYKLCDATVGKLQPLLSESQGRRLKAALKGTISAPHGVRIGIGSDGVLTVEQPAPSAIVDLWLSQYAGGVELAGSQAADLKDKLTPLAEQFAKLQSAMASTYVSSGDKDDPAEVQKRRDERARQEKELGKQQKPRHEILKAVREAINQGLLPEQRQAAKKDRQAELEASAQPLLNYYRGWANRADLSLSPEQKQKMLGLVDAAGEALAKIAGGDEDEFPTAWNQLYRQLSRDLLAVMTPEQKEKLTGPPPTRPATKTQSPKAAPPKTEPPKQGDSPKASDPLVLPPL